MAIPRYPLLYQINTRVWLTDLSRSLGRNATLDDIRDAELDDIARMGFDWVWLLSVWQTGPAAQESRARILSGATNSRRRCTICKTPTLPARASPSPGMQCMKRWVGTKRWDEFANGFAAAGCG